MSYLSIKRRVELKAQREAIEQTAMFGVETTWQDIIRRAIGFGMRQALPHTHDWPAVPTQPKTTRPRAARLIKTTPKRKQPSTQTGGKRLGCPMRENMPTDCHQPRCLDCRDAGEPLFTNKGITVQK